MDFVGFRPRMEVVLLEILTYYQQTQKSTGLLVSLMSHPWICDKQAWINLPSALPEGVLLRLWRDGSFLAHGKAPAMEPLADIVQCVLRVMKHHFSGLPGG